MCGCKTTSNNQTKTQSTNPKNGVRTIKIRG